MLETGRAAAYVLDDVQLAVAIARSKDPSAYMISEETLSRAEPYGIMLRQPGPGKLRALRPAELRIGVRATAFSASLLERQAAFSRDTQTARLGR